MKVTTSKAGSSPKAISDRVEKFLSHENMNKVHPKHLSEVAANGVRLIRDYDCEVTEPQYGIFLQKRDKGGETLGENLVVYKSGKVSLSTSVMGMWHGPVTFYYSNGAKRVVNHMEDAAHGHGMYYHPNGRIDDEVWNNGRQVKDDIRPEDRELFDFGGISLSQDKDSAHQHRQETSE